MKKKCFKCNQVKKIDMFYKHSQMADGHLNKCKSCAKKDVKERYYSEEGHKKIVEYEKKRFQDPKRKEKVITYQKRMRTKNPGKYRARLVVSNAKKYGLLKKEPCNVCGHEHAEAHHKDYRKPLDITWLCRKHHMQAEGKNCWIR